MTRVSIAGSHRDLCFKGLNYSKDYVSLLALLLRIPHPLCVKFRRRLYFHTHALYLCTTVESTPSSDKCGFAACLYTLCLVPYHTDVPSLVSSRSHIVCFDGAAQSNGLWKNETVPLNLGGQIIPMWIRRSSSGSGCSS